MTDDISADAEFESYVAELLSDAPPLRLEQVAILRRVFGTADAGAVAA